MVQKTTVKRARGSSGRGTTVRPGATRWTGSTTLLVLVHVVALLCAPSAWAHGMEQPAQQQPVQRQRQQKEETNGMTQFVAAAKTAAPVVDERAILLEFYEATGGSSSWNDNVGWDELTEDYCDWHGVICTGEADMEMLFDHTVDLRSSSSSGNGQRSLVFAQEDDSATTTTDGATTKSRTAFTNKVMGLELPNNFLQGRTPPSLWRLPLLQYLNVNQNEKLQVDLGQVYQAPQLSIVKMSQTATSSLAGLEHASLTLDVLHLTETPLQSALPPEILALTNLRDLQLSSCGLEGDLSGLEALTNLRDLNLFNNRLKGPLPTAMSQLVRLERVSLARNQLTGDLHVVDAWIELVELYLAENQFSGPLPALSAMPRLKKVYLNQNRLTGDIPDDAVFLQSLLMLDSNFEDDAPVIDVDLSRNQLTGTVPKSLDVLEALSLHLFLHDNLFTGIATDLCDNIYWNRNATRDYGCDGLLCPNGTYSPIMGHAMDPDHVCQPCTTAHYFGTTTCVQENDDRSALLALYQATMGQSWTNSTGWKYAYDQSMLDKSDVCDWHGIECWDGSGDVDSTGGRVRVINLAGNNLEGTIPEDIYSMLPFMQTLKLARNPRLVLPMIKMGTSSQFRHLDISQTATVSFDGLEKAQDVFAYLVADGLQVGGTLPTQLLNLTGLKLISMAECELVGTLPTELGFLGQLNELYLYDNNLMGTLPTTLGQMSALRVISLAQNQLTGTLPPSLDALTNLQALSLSDQVSKGGGISGPLKTFRFHPFLKSLQLSHNLLEGTVPVQLLEGAEVVTSILQVSLANNRLSGTVPGELARFQHLDLALQGNRFTAMDNRLCENTEWMNGLVADYKCDAILCPVGTAGGRQMYDSQPCQPCPSVSDSMGGVSSKWLGQEHCHVEFSIEESDEQGLVEMLFQQTKGENWNNNRNWLLQKKQVDGGQIHVCEWHGISCDESESIIGITLGANNLQGTMPTLIYMLPNLEVLSLFGNEKLVVPMDGIDNASNLRLLILDSTGLNSIEGIGKARSLTELNVQNNALKGTLPEELSRLINLRSLSISKNAFSGTIPYWIKSLPYLDTFLAADNKLQGPLPDFANVPSMSYLDLSGNNLSGEIPLTFLQSVVHDNEKIVVDLSNNEIEGSVPRELARLSRLTIHLQNNHLTDIDRELCAVTGWNDFDVEIFGCDGILCPAGTSSPMGRQTLDVVPCTPCKEATYMGSTACYASSAAPTRVGFVGFSSSSFLWTIVTLIATTTAAMGF